MRLARIDNRYLPIFHHHWRLTPHEEPVQLRGIVELEPGPQTPPESFFVKAPGQSLPGTIDQGERLHDRYPLRQFHGGTGSASAHRPAFTFRASLSSASVRCLSLHIVYTTRPGPDRTSSRFAAALCGSLYEPEVL